MQRIGGFIYSISNEFRLHSEIFTSECNFTCRINGVKLCTRILKNGTDRFCNLIHRCGNGINSFHRHTACKNSVIKVRQHTAEEPYQCGFSAPAFSAEQDAFACFNREVDIFEAWRIRLFIRKRNILNMDHSLTPSILTMHIPAKIPVTRIKSATSCRLKPISVIQVCVPGLSSPLHNAAAASSSLMFKIEIKRGINIYVIVSDGLNKRLRALHSIPRIRIAD